jgi:hypothetical protein
VSNRKRIQAPRPAPTAKKPDDGPNVVVAFIHPGECSTYFTVSLLGMMLYDYTHSRHIRNIIHTQSSANISEARNELTQRFLDEYPDGTHLLWIDADMSFDHDSLDRLLVHSSVEQAPIIGGLCFGNAATGVFPTLYQLGLNEDEQPVMIRQREYQENAMVGCTATGGAFILIHRKVIEDIRDQNFNPVFRWYQETTFADKPCGEDITFCMRALKCGHQTWVNTSVKIGHHKSVLLTEELFQEQERLTAYDAAAQSSES